MKNRLCPSKRESAGTDSYSILCYISKKIPFGEAGQAEAWRSNGSFFSERENQDL